MMLPNYIFNHFRFCVIALIMFITACDQTVPESTSNPDNTELLLHIPSPDWRDQVIYFLMTDRFNDGDPANNDQGIGEYNPRKSSHYSGGDLQGVIDQLDYIQNMGMTAVWTTPWVANQWWSNETNYGGYHGYWAVNFNEVDKHLGTMDTLKRLSDQLHRREMYLIQDVVVNHTGNFFNYRNGQDGYDPNDTAKNFYLFEDENSAQPKPTQSPFHQIDRNNPEHVAADIYNWTPSIRDYQNYDVLHTYQLARLADINTKNPMVVETFKQTYGDWINTIGVDAFRIDTVRYVEHEFFHHFMHDNNGIHARAKATGRDNFLAFGEVYDVSQAYQNDAEHRVASYLGTSDKPELNSQISFPLHQELRTVFAQGFPTDHLAYRLEQHMAIYPNPYVFPTFIDNHDMSRFLSSGDTVGLKQALATIFTIPGIPTIYQGTAQAMTETRTAMFKGGFGAKKNAFDQESELYQFIQLMARMRTSDKLFTRGDFEILASNKTGPGVIAYKRSYADRQAVILMNTATSRILVDGIEVSDEPGTLEPIYGFDKKIDLNASGELSVELPGRAIFIAELQRHDISTSLKERPILRLDAESDSSEVQHTVYGTTPYPESPVFMVKNNKLETAIRVTPDDNGEWAYKYEVKNLGQEDVSLVAYQPEQQVVSDPVTFTTQVTKAEFEARVTDTTNSDNGLDKTYAAPQHSQSVGQQDIVAAEVSTGGEILLLTLVMNELTDDWIPTNGFDNVAFSIYFDLPTTDGATILPHLNTHMPGPWNWDIGHVVYGWGNTTFASTDASAEAFGKKFGVAPTVTVNKAAKSIQFKYNAADFGITGWRGSHIYITTWDITGEGRYRELTQDISDWSFSGGEANDPKIFDALKISL